MLAGLPKPRNKKVGITTLAKIIATLRSSAFSNVRVNVKLRVSFLGVSVRSFTKNGVK